MNITVNNIYNKNQDFKVLPARKKIETKATNFTNNDGLDISEKTQEIQNANQLAKSTPDIREDKVKQIQERIKSGNYKVDLGKIADKILAN